MTAVAESTSPPGARADAGFRVAVVGVPIAVAAADAVVADRRADWVRRALALTAGPAPGPSLRIAVRPDGEPPEPPAGARQIAAMGEARVLSDGDRVFIGFPQAHCTVHLSGGSASIWLADGWWREPVKLQQIPWLSTLAWLLRERGRFTLHAGAVARQGTGLLFAGESGCGKSSSALAMIQAGWDWLADDVALLQPGAEPRLFGFARGFSFDPALAGRLPGLVGEPLAGKRFASIEGLFAGRRVATCRPAAVLLPQVTREATSRLLPASPAEVLLALLPASGFILAGGAPRGREPTCRRCGIWSAPFPPTGSMPGRISSATAWRSRRCCGRPVWTLATDGAGLPVIRPATGADARAVAVLCEQEARQQEALGGYPLVPGFDWTIWVARLLVAPGARCLVAERDGAILAFVLTRLLAAPAADGARAGGRDWRGLSRRVAGLLRRSLRRTVSSSPARVEGRARLESLFVVPAERRRGLGGRLVEAAKAELAAQGVHSVEISVMVDNGAAMAFWRGQGVRPFRAHLLADLDAPWSGRA